MNPAAVFATPADLHEPRQGVPDRCMGDALKAIRLTTRKMLLTSNL